jgi:hypothetical protein
MKKGWDRYASEKRYVKKGYLRKHRNGSACRKATETGCCNCIQQSGESQEEIEMLVRPELPLCHSELLAKEIEWFGKVVLITEQVNIGEENGKSEVGIGQPIQSSGEISCEVRSEQSGSGCSGSRNEKVRKRKNGKDGRSRKEKS